MANHHRPQRNPAHPARSQTHPRTPNTVADNLADPTAGPELFRHITADGELTVIRVPNEYVELRLDQRTVIAKIHGAVDRLHGANSFVITEDHYIHYITRADVTGLFPVKLAAKLRTSHSLFLGYSLRDWNVPAMLYRLWGEQEGKNFKSWAIQDNPDPIDRAAWDERDVDILPVRVEDFDAAVEQRLSPNTSNNNFPLPVNTR